MFDWTAHEQELQIVEIPTDCGYDQKRKRDLVELRKWALNVKLYDKLQEPFITALEKGEKSTKQSGKPAKSDGKKQTPAQIAADAKRKAAESEKRLDTFTGDWIQRLLRSTLAERYIDDALVARTIAWLTSCAQSWGGHSLRTHAEQALIDCQIATAKGKYYGCDQLQSVMGMGTGDGQEFKLVATFWRLILWPVSELISDKANRKCLLTPAGQLPDRMMQIDEADLWQLTKIANVSIGFGWKLGTVDDSDQRRLISVWLMRHTKDQLHKLRDELNVTEGGSHMGRDELAAAFSMHIDQVKHCRYPNDY